MNLKKNEIKETHQRLNMKYPTKKKNKREEELKEEWFKQWLVGYTDGKGSFQINLERITFKLTESKENGKLLHRIKKELKCGSITEEEYKLNYIIRDKKNIKNVIIPIFDKYPLLTSKYIDYIKFKQVLEIETPIDSARNYKIKEIQQKEPTILDGDSWVHSINESNILSPVWRSEGRSGPDLNYYNSKISKGWLTGYIESKVSLKIERMYHGIEISEKKDRIVLESIRKILHIPSKVKNKKTYLILENKNNRVNLDFIKYFKGSFKGIKSVELSIWSRTLIKSKNIKDPNKKLKYLENTESKLRSLVFKNKIENDQS